jgi:hypothetical protein
MNTSIESTRTSARVVGILVLGAFFVYGIGSAIATSVVDAPDYLSHVSGNAVFTLGAVMMVLNSAVVIGIGILMYPILKPHNRNIALGYFGTRIFEATFLTVGALSLLSVAAIGNQAATHGSTDVAFFESMAAVAIADSATAYNVAMAGLGFGSLFFCYLLLRSGLVPRFLAVWGFVGYAAFAAGSVLELFGFTGAGLVGVIPGGLFEVFFGIWLIVKGFNSTGANVSPAEAEPVRISQPL